jgi:hypothetical protein
LQDFKSAFEDGVGDYLAICPKVKMRRVAVIAGRQFGDGIGDLLFR